MKKGVSLRKAIERGIAATNKNWTYHQVSEEADKVYNAIDPDALEEDEDIDDEDGGIDESKKRSVSSRSRKRKIKEESEDDVEAKKRSSRKNRKKVTESAEGDEDDIEEEGDEDDIEESRKSKRRGRVFEEDEEDFDESDVEESRRRKARVKRGARFDEEDEDLEESTDDDLDEECDDCEDEDIDEEADDIEEDEDIDDEDGESLDEDGEEDEDIDDDELFEDVEVGTVLSVRDAFSFEDEDGEDIYVGINYFIVAKGTSDDDSLVVDIYDDLSNLVADGVEISTEDVAEIIDSEIAKVVDKDEIAVHDDWGVDEAFCTFKAGKTKKFKMVKESTKRRKPKFLRLTSKARSKVRRKIKESKKVNNLSKSKLAKRKMARVRINRLYNRVNFNSNYEVCEGFDVTLNNKGSKKSMPLESGDIIKFKKGKNITFTAYRGRKTVFEGVVVDKSFIKRCLNTGLMAKAGKAVSLYESKKSPRKGSVLKYTSGKGFSIIKEGKERVIGNRVKARSALIKEGVKVTSDMLGRAFDGELVRI